MARPKMPGLHPVNCCGMFLCSAPANTAVKCPECNKWQKVPGRKEREKENASNCIQLNDD